VSAPRFCRAFEIVEVLVQSANEPVTMNDLMYADRPRRIGKTRLAPEMARILLPGFDGGAWLVEPASPSDACLVTAAIASSAFISPEALALAHQAIKEAEQTDHPVSLSVVVPVDRRSPGRGGARGLVHFAC
jgi:hypothetical protein